MLATPVAPSGELDIACAPALREQFLGLLRPHASRLVVDLSHVSFCDASPGGAQRAAAAGADISSITRAPPSRGALNP